jgi:SP family general alpha glucoside:H+ symporter-like MFS transporter
MPPSSTTSPATGEPTSTLTASSHIENPQENDPIVDAQLAHLSNQHEHQDGILASFVRYPWASAWCVYACWCIILLSFDVQAGGAVVGIPQFRKDFGHEFDGGYVLSAKWQSAFGGAPIAT